MARARRVNRSEPLDVPVAQAVARGVLAVAARSGWAGVTPAAVARAAKVPEASVTRLAQDRIALLRVVGDQIDAQIDYVITSEENQAGASAKDQLFEVLMARFDILQADRAGYTALIDGVFADPCAVTASARPLLASMARVVRAARGQGLGATNRRVFDTPKVIIISIVYLAVLRVWLNDQSPDLTATMAALDRRLGQAAAFFGE